ncbi:MAG: protein-disulfide isomerase [Patescibacteria group bacterium]
MQISRKAAIAIALVVIVGALILRYQNKPNEEIHVANNAKGSIPGLAGSEHSHMSILVMINGEPVDFSQARYQLQSDLVHFEDGDGVYIHKHATGITLSYLFETLKIKLTDDCITLDSGLEYCSDGKASLKTYLNRELFVDWDKYELRDGDKILIDYGTSTEFDIALLLNSVPDLSSDLSEL